VIIGNHRSSEAPYLERRAARQPERRLEQAHVPNMARAVEIKREARERRLERSHVRALPGCAIRCNQVQSGAIRFNYEHSQVVSCARACIERAPTVEGDWREIGCNQRRSEGDWREIGGRTSGNQRQPHLRVGNQRRQSEAIRGHQRQPHLRVGIERARGVEVDT
jgi:hypothetical protein